MDLETFRRFQLLAAKSAQISTPLVIRRVTVCLYFVLLQHRLVLVNFPANVAFVLDILRVGFLELFFR